MLTGIDQSFSFVYWNCWVNVSVFDWFYYFKTDTYYSYSLK